MYIHFEQTKKNALTMEAFLEVLKMMLEELEEDKKTWMEDNPYEKLDKNFLLGVTLGFELNRRRVKRYIKNMEDYLNNNKKKNKEKEKNG